MSYIGSTPTTQSFIAGTDYFNGTGSQTAFTLSRSVVSVNDIEVVINNVEQQPNTAYTVSGTTITFTSAPSAGTANIYVRYLSTTTQSITPSQNTVSYSTMDSNMQAKQGISFKNKIINGAMVIDQRNAGASTTPTNGAYTLDRWGCEVSQSSKLTVQQNAASVTPPVGFVNYLGVTSSSSYSVGSGDYFTLFQRIEGYNSADLNWGSANAKTVTLSFWVRSSLTGTFGGSLKNESGSYSYPFAYTISAANTWEQKSITIVGPSSSTWGTSNGIGIQVYFGLGVGSTYGNGTAGAWVAGNFVSSTGAVSVVGTSGATWYVTGVQLEVGTQATTFDYRSIGTELALCQRYCISYSNAADGNDRWFGFAYLNNYSINNVYFPVTMRTGPSATISTANAFTVYSNGSSYNPSTISLDGYSAIGANVYNNATCTAGQGTILAFNTSGNKITFSAEL